ncbi:S9 family peptidase [Ilumatobacter sp.]|uniref:S9 family peptidase n=1 Tax=Ilumatobacter sp. TaxID=1967498 RepID=UPI003C323C00
MDHQNLPSPTSVTPSGDASATPVAPRRAHRWVRPTGDVDDDFAWMIDVEDPELLEYLTAENRFGDAWFAPHAATTEAIFEEIRSRVQETDQSTPVMNGGWWYVGSTVEGENYPRHHRGRTFESATDFLLLDENVEAERIGATDYFDLGAFDGSHDHTMFAWSTDTTGDERYDLRIRRCDDDGGVEDLEDHITEVANAGTAWSADGSRLFYVRADDQERPFQVWRHEIGRPAADDTLVFQEDDERFFVEIGETRSDTWIVIHCGSKTSAEVRLLPSNSPLDEPIVVQPRADGVEYQVDDWGDRLVMVTNADGADDFCIRTASSGDDWTDPSAWSELVAHLPGRRIIGVEPFEHQLVIYEWSNAQPRLRLLFRDGTERIVDVDNEPHDVGLSANPEWTSTTLRFVTQSMTSPATLYDDDLLTGERTLLRQVPTPNVDLDSYVASRMWATSADGTSVPVDIVRHVDTPLDGTAAGCLYGYGSYEASMPPWFSVGRLSLLDRGLVWALAHPRGGGELGRHWYLDGKLEHKQHTFDDMIAVAEHLGTAGVVARDRLAIRGGSAGGLLVGACMTQRPDLFASVIAEVPFVDIVNTMSDPSLPLTVTEWEEWGDPRSEPFATAMLAYSPYDNTVEADYPAVYVTAGLHDPRVSVHEPAKWVARLRDTTTSGRPIVMRTEMGAGHGGPTGRYDAWRDEARTLAFLLATT